MINISEKISSLRKAHNLTQEALGEAVGVSAQAVSKWEKGDSLPDISIIPDICKVFGISADTLLGNTSNMTVEIYAQKTHELFKSTWDKIKLIHKIMISDEYKSISFSVADADMFSVTDSRGFGMYVKEIEYIKDMMPIDLTQSELLKIMSDEKAIRIFQFICINGRLTESEIIKLTGFTQQEMEERLFKLMKCAVISTVTEDKETAYTTSDHNAILLIGILSSTYLFDSASREGIEGTGQGRNTNPEKLRKFMD